jgi:multicomponent Na+:H+ antiporter subunit D
MSEHLPILVVLPPLLAAPACVVLRDHRLVRALAVAAGGAAFAATVLLLRQVLGGDTVVYALGGWPAPIGIEFRVDALNAFAALVVAANAAVVLPYAGFSLGREVPRERVYLVMALLLLCQGGLLGLALTGDLFNVFVLLEIASLASYVLIAMGRWRRSLIAAFQYLIIGTIGSSFILIGIGMAYMMTGTLNMADLAVRLPPVEETRTVLAAFAFLTVGISIKLALFPLHSWLPDAYTYAPSAVSAFIASSSTKVVFYLLVRIIFTVFGVAFAFSDLALNAVLRPLALAAIGVASTVAIFQSNIKRLLAYSSIAQIGYMVLGLSFGSVHGLTAGIVHMFNHGLMKGGLFLAVGCLMYRVGSVRLEDLRGVARRMPWTMAAFVVGGLNLIGVPGTAGFVTKWYLVLAALERGSWGVAAFTVFSSLLAAAYVWRVVESAYFKPEVPQPRLDEVREAPLALLGPVWLMMGATLVFGVYAAFPVQAARTAAILLLGGAR